MVIRSDPVLIHINVSYRRTISTALTKTLQLSSVKSWLALLRMPISHSISSLPSSQATRLQVRCFHTYAEINCTIQCTTTAPALGLVAHAGARPRRPRPDQAEAVPPAADATPAAVKQEAAAEAAREAAEEPEERAHTLEQATADAQAAQPTGDTLGTSDVHITVGWMCTRDVVCVYAPIYCCCIGVVSPAPLLCCASACCSQAPFLLKGQLREYQLIGLNWLVSLNQRRLNGILAVCSCHSAVLLYVVVVCCGCMHPLQCFVIPSLC